MVALLTLYHRCTKIPTKAPYGLGALDDLTRGIPRGCDGP